MLACGKAGQKSRPTLRMRGTFAKKAVKSNLRLKNIGKGVLRHDSMWGYTNLQSYSWLIRAAPALAD